MEILFVVFLAFIAAFLYYRVTTDKKDATANIQQGKEYLEQNAKEEGVITTASGLQYQVLQAGTGEEKPTASDTVTVHYHGTMLDGTVFDSSVNRGEPMTFALNRVIRGWTEGLQLMVVGEKSRLVIPSHLAYGPRANGPIKAGSTLVFEVELLAINK